MTTWTKRKISDIAIEQRIPYTPNPTENLSYIGLEHIKESSLKLNSIGNSREVNSQKKKFYKGDILYGSLRPYFRKVIKAKFDGVSSTDITILKPKGNIDRDFLFYLVASEEFINKASMASNGTKMPRAGWKIVKDFSFDIPEPGIQSKIGSMLSAYDDLIENNEKRIKILEEMAQRLYTEWFVKFKFPGHKKVKIVDSPLGKIPEDWEVKRLRNIIDVIGGLSYKNEFLTNNSSDISLITMGSVHPSNPFNDKNAQYYSGSYKESNMVKSGDLVIATRDVTSERNILGSPVLIPKYLDKAIVATNMYKVINSSYLSNSFLYLLFRSQRFRKRMIGFAHGTNILMIVKNDVLNYQFVCPKENTSQSLDPLISRLLDMIESLMLTNMKVSQMRDFLIPQLVIGKRELK